MYSSGRMDICNAVSYTHLIFGDSGFLTTVFALESSENSIDIKTEGQNILSKVPTDISDVPEVPTKSPVESETPKVTETPEAVSYTHLRGKYFCK